MTISSVDAGVELSSSQPIRDAVKLKASNGGVSLVSDGSYGISLVTTASPITLSASGSASGFALVGPARCCPPRHRHAFEPSFLEVNGIL